MSSYRTPRGNARKILLRRQGDAMTRPTRRSGIQPSHFRGIQLPAPSAINVRWTNTVDDGVKPRCLDKGPTACTIIAGVRQVQFEPVL